MESQKLSSLLMLGEASKTQNCINIQKGREENKNECLQIFTKHLLK